MYLVICYAIHYRDIASINKFDNWEQAMNFLRSDVSDICEETKEEVIDPENVKCIIKNNYAQLSADNGEYTLTWHVVEVPN